MKIRLLAPLAATLLAAAAQAQAPQAAPPVATPVAVIVKVPTPWYAPRFVVAGKMRDTIPQYEQLPGLDYKMFSFARADGDFGGIYLWKTRAAADQWFNTAWFERVRKERGAEGNVRIFEVPVVLENTATVAAASTEGNAVATLVTIPVPPGVSRDRLVAEFQASIPLYQKVPGLMRKYYIITTDGRFGGIYLWDSQAGGERWFNTAWHERGRAAYGSDARIEWFDTPILLPTKVATNRIELARP